MIIIITRHRHTRWLRRLCTPHRYIEVLPQDHVLVKLDFTNAFNSIHRRDMLHSVYNRFPELYAYCQSAYGKTSPMFLGHMSFHPRRVHNRATRRGLLFCNTMHPVVFTSGTESRLSGRCIMYNVCYHSFILA